MTAAACAGGQDAIVHIIIGMPAQDIIIGMPIAIIAFMALQRSRIMSICVASIGIILQVMPSFVISQVMRHIIGIIIGIGIIMGIGIWPDIIGFIIIGFMPPIGLIMPFIIGFGIIPLGIGMLFIGIGIGMFMALSSCPVKVGTTPI